MIMLLDQIGTATKTWVSQTKTQTKIESGQPRSGLFIPEESVNYVKMNAYLWKHIFIQKITSQSQVVTIMYNNNEIHVIYQHNIPDKFNINYMMIVISTHPWSMMLEEKHMPPC